MRKRRSPLVLALGLLASGVAPAAAAASDDSAAATLVASMLPPIPRGSLHPDPGLYLLCPNDAEVGCVRFDAQVEKAAAMPDTAVVLIHGLDDSGDVWRELAPALHDVGRTVLFFEYPNDQAVALSADALAAALRDARARGLSRVDLVCHSMGGLVARDALTRAEHYNGDADAHDDLPHVDRAILIATPNAGAPIAWVRAPNDLIERTIAWRNADAPVGAIFDLATDGDGQAGIDLRPGSDFLTELNARPAPSGVHLTVIVAQAIGQTPANSHATETDVAGAATPRRGVSARVRSWWSRLVLEVIQALGDGAVPTDSASLDSADETLHVRCSHIGLLKDDPVGGWILENTGQNPQHAPAVSLVLERVSAAADPAEDR